MGTSINTCSPDTTVWNVVAACYDNDIPVERIATLLWRAITTENVRLVSQLKSDLAAKFAYGSILAGTTRSVSDEQPPPQNSIAAELVKRSALIRSASGNESLSPLAAAFRELTNYYVARDISGHVGPGHRCKTFTEVRCFKQKLGDFIAAKVQRVEREHKLHAQQWPTSVDMVLKSLTKV